MKTLVPVLLLLLASLTATAQVDVKLNAGSAIFRGVGVAGEFPIGAQSGLSLGVGYSGIGLRYDGKDEYSYRNLRFIPEYRYYFAPRDGMDRFFAGGYGKLGRLTGIDRDTDERVTATRAALGILAGHKWVAPSGFVFELNAGVGSALSFGGGSIQNVLYEKAIAALTAFDVRLGILVGWRL